MIKSHRTRHTRFIACGFVVIFIPILTASPAIAQEEGQPPPDAGKYDHWDMQSKWIARYPESRTSTTQFKLPNSSELGIDAPDGPLFTWLGDDAATKRKLEDTPRLTVRGEAQLDKPADQIEISIGVETESENADEAMEQNNERMHAVINAIEQTGLTEDEYETGQFRIRPQYSRRPRQSDPNWRPQIIGYQVTNSINIKTKKLEQAGEILGAASEAGANTVDVRGFSLSDPRKYRREAIAEATGNAIADARVLASAASLRLVRIININLDSSPMYRPQPMQMEMMRGAAVADAAPPITPGDVTIQANVTIVYEIEQAQID